MEGPVEKFSVCCPRVVASSYRPNRTITQLSPSMTQRLGRLQILVQIKVQIWSKHLLMHLFCTHVNESCVESVLLVLLGVRALLGHDFDRLAALVAAITVDYHLYCACRPRMWMSFAIHVKLKMVKLTQSVKTIVIQSRSIFVSDFLTCCSLTPTSWRWTRRRGRARFRWCRTWERAWWDHVCPDWRRRGPVLYHRKKSK